MHRLEIFKSYIYLIWNVSRLMIYGGRVKRSNVLHHGEYVTVIDNDDVYKIYVYYIFICGRVENVLKIRLEKVHDGFSACVWRE